VVKMRHPYGRRLFEFSLSCLYIYNFIPMSWILMWGHPPTTALDTVCVVASTLAHGRNTFEFTACFWTRRLFST
jgi:hypothetical protein